LQALLGEAGQVADGMNNTRMKAMADRLGDSLLEETTVDELDAALLDVAGDEAAADMAALTETGRGLARAAVDRYTIASGVTQYEWVTAGGAKVCAQCEANEAVGPIEIGKSFPYGTAPPAHPYCRCALLPVLL
jgi:SPP1 gp7 family putative phage head morphogenesis protein